MINRLQNAQGTEKQKLYDDLILRIESTGDTSLSKPLLQRIITVAQRKNDQANYYRYLIYLSRYLGVDGQSLRQKVIAETGATEWLILLKGQACKEAATYFMNLEQYDSVAVYLLMAKDIFEPRRQMDELSDIHQTLGDLFYVGFLYNESEIEYKKVLEIYKNSANLPAWRKYVCIDNLALIELRRKNWEKAKEYFTRTLTWKLTYNNGVLTRDDSIAVCYIYQELSIIAYRQKNDNEFLNVWDKSISIAKALDLSKNTDVLYEIRGIYMYDHQQFDSAKVYLSKSLEINQHTSHRMVSGETYQYLALTYNALGDHKKAWLIQSQYSIIADSLNAGIQRSKFLGHLFHYEFDKYEDHVARLKTEKYTLYGALIVLAILLGWVSLIHFKLRRANSYLAKKNLESIQPNRFASTKLPTPYILKPDESGTDSIPESEVTNGQDSDGVSTENIINQLEAYMLSDKPYLDNKLTIEQLARQLNTNRYYLSRAINSGFGMNFSGYINKYRVNEAISLLSSPDYQHYTLEGIANTVGFNSRTSFISAFQKQTGLLPSYFRKKINNP